MSRSGAAEGRAECSPDDVLATGFVSTHGVHRQSGRRADDLDLRTSPPAAAVPGEHRNIGRRCDACSRCGVPPGILLEEIASKY